MTFFSRLIIATPWKWSSTIYEQNKLMHHMTQTMMVFTSVIENAHKMASSITKPMNHLHLLWCTSKHFSPASSIKSSVWLCMILLPFSFLLWNAVASLTLVRFPLMKIFVEILKLCFRLSSCSNVFYAKGLSYSTFC